MPSKMYILVRDEMIKKHPGHAILSVAHAAAAAILKWSDKPSARTLGFDPIEDWAKNSFRKVLCRVSDEQFKDAMTFGQTGEAWLLMTESALRREKMCLVFRPKLEFSKFFKQLPLWEEKAQLEELFEVATPERITEVLTEMNEDDERNGEGGTALYKGVCFD